MPVEQEGTAAHGAFFEVLRNAPFLRLWGAQAISMTAQSMVNFAVIVFTERLTQSSFFTSLAVLSFTLPAVAVGTFAGVVVDRSNKARVLLISNVLRMVLMIGFFFAESEAPAALRLAVIFTLTAAFSIVSQFFGPAEAATIPLVVPRRHLLAANALFATTYNASLVLGLAVIGPLLVSLLGLGRLWLFVAILYAVSALLVARLPAGEAKLVEQAVGTGPWTRFRQLYWEPVRESWQFMIRQPAIRTATINLSLAATILLVVSTLGPGFVSRTLGRNPEDLSLVVLPASLGMLTGIILVGRVVIRVGSRKLIGFSMAGAGTLLILMATTQSWSGAIGQLVMGDQFDATMQGTLAIAGAMVAAYGLGIAHSFVTVPANTELQAETSEEMRGRVFASLFMIIGFLSMLPVLFAGALADIIGLITVMVLVALLMIFTGAMTLRRGVHKDPTSAP